MWEKTIVFKQFNIQHISKETMIRLIMTASKRNFTAFNKRASLVVATYGFQMVDRLFQTAGAF